MRKKLLLTGLVALLLSPILSCEKQSETGNVPQVPVDEYIDLNLPSFIALNVVNGWIYYPAGNKGILVFRSSPTEFTALERTCTFDPYSSCLIEVENNGLLAIDTCCGSRFSIYDGSVTNGPASQALFRYRSDILQGNILHIYN